MKVYFQRHSISAPFLDIKGSTRLALKYDLETVQKIKNAVLSTGIEIIRYFGGHIHRLQGDAILLLLDIVNFKK